MSVLHLWTTGNSEEMRSKVLACQLFAIEDRCSAHCKGAGQGAGNKVPRAYGGNTEGLLGMRRARNTVNSIFARNQGRRYWVYSGNYPEHSSLTRMHEMQKPSISQGLYKSRYYPYRLQQPAPTPASEFHGNQTPDLSYLRRWSNHSATSAVHLYGTLST